jgi:hypothetical protein
MFISFPAKPTETPLEIALNAAEKFIHDAIWLITFAIAFTYYMGQEFGKSFYKVRQAASEIDLEDLEAPIVQPTTDLETLTGNQLKALCKNRCIVFKSKVTKPQLIALLAS